MCDLQEVPVGGEDGDGSVIAHLLSVLLPLLLLRLLPLLLLYATPSAQTTTAAFPQAGVCCGPRRCGLSTESLW